MKIKGNILAVILTFVMAVISVPAYGVAYAPGTGYTDVTNVNQLNDNDHVIIFGREGGYAITGFDGNNSATYIAYADHESDWKKYAKEFVVVKPASGTTFKLYDAAQGAYISNADKNEFKYDATGSDYTIQADGSNSGGWLKNSTNGRLLRSNGTLIRFYSTNTGNAVFVYKVDTPSEDAPVYAQMNDITIDAGEFAGNTISATSDEYSLNLTFNSCGKTWNGNIINSDADLTLQWRKGNGSAFSSGDNTSDFSYTHDNSNGCASVKATFKLYYILSASKPEYHAQLMFYTTDYASTVYVNVTINVTNPPTFYNVTYNANGGTGTTTDINSPYPEGSSVAAINNNFEREGYEFVGWKIDNSGALIAPEGIVTESINSDIELFAQWSPVYDVTYNANGGDGTLTDANSPYSAGEVVMALPNTFVRSGYEFTGWKIENDGTLIAPGNSITTNISGNIELYAQWSPVYTIVYDGNGGDGTLTDTSSPYSAGNAVSALPNTFIRNGFEFTGWNTAQDGSGTAIEPGAQISASINQNYTLYAQWEAVTYKDYIFTCVDYLVSAPNGKALITTKAGNAILAKNYIYVIVEHGIANHKVDISGPDLLFYTRDGSGYHPINASNPLRIDSEGDFAQRVYVAYSPSEAGDGRVISPEFTISCDGYSETFNSDGSLLRVRNMPERFAIAAKSGTEYHIMPGDINTPGNPDAPEATVENGEVTADKIHAYTIWPVRGHTAERFLANGAAVRFSAINNGNKGLWGNNSNSVNTIQNFAVISSAESTAAEANYEWTIETTEVDGTFKYELHKKCGDNERYLCYSSGGKWGTYPSGITELWFLPIQSDMSSNVLWKVDGFVIEGASSGTLLHNGNSAVHIDGERNDDKDILSFNTPLTFRNTLRFTADGNTFTAKVPAIVSGIADDTEETWGSEDIVILPGAKLTLDRSKHKAARNLYIYRQNDHSGQLDMNGGSLSLTGAAHLVLTIDPTRYYFFGLPHTFDLKQSGYLNGDNPNYDTSDASANWWILQYYNGARRASVGSDENNWTGIHDNGEPVLALGAAEGHAIGIDIVGKANAQRSYVFPFDPHTDQENSGKTLEVVAHPVSAPRTQLDEGWNMLANPYLHTISTKGATLPSNKLLYLVLPYKGTDQRFQQYLAAEINNIEPFDVFFVQVRGSENGTLSLPGNAARPSAPKRRTQTEDNDTYMLRLVLTAPDNDSDHATIIVNEDFKADEFTMEDQTKFGSGNYIQLYTIEQDQRLAFDAMNANDASRGTQLGYHAAMAGEYNLRFTELNGYTSGLEAVLLTDSETGATTDLLKQDAKFTTAAGTYNQRLKITVLFKQDNVNTSLDTSSEGIGSVSQRNGQIVIEDIRGNADVRIYDSTGKLLAQRIVNGAWQSATLPQGVYMVRINGVTTKIVL